MRLRVASFNLWLGGAGGGLPPERSLDVIRRADADIVGLQETGAIGPWLARSLGWSYLQQDEGTGILTRFPLVGPTSGRLGARLALPDGDTLHAFNVHLPHAPYQPYQLLGIPYADAPFLRDAAEAITAAKAARGQEVANLIAEAGALRAVVTGDFNEPSHLDWTDAACAAGLCPIPVAWPSTTALAEAGFVDAFRSVHPDPVGAPGHTWTTTTAPDDPRDHHDRIDFVLYRGPDLVALDAARIGEDAAPFPSDHRMVVCTLAKTGSGARESSGMVDTMGKHTPHNEVG